MNGTSLKSASIYLAGIVTVIVAIVLVLLVYGLGIYYVGIFYSKWLCPVALLVSILLIVNQINSLVAFMRKALELEKETNDNNDQPNSEGS